jgi:hypothetical protein
MWLSNNTEARDLFLENYDKINWYFIASNPVIFQYDYAAMTCPFKEELFAVIYHPDNISKLNAF